MVTLAPLPVVDEFLRQYSVGQAILLLFVLTILAGFALKSRKALAAIVLLFGFVFLATPSSLAAFPFRLLGLGLLLVGPLLYVTGER
jgi:hypothetical protein